MQRIICLHELCLRTKYMSQRPAFVLENKSKLYGYTTSNNSCSELRVVFCLSKNNFNESEVAVN